MRSLTSPALPNEKSFDELATTLQSHFQPKPLLIVERFHFHRRDQAADKSIAEYVAELRRLSTNCEFGDTLNDALRDRLVCGMRNTSAQKRLLAESDLTFIRVLELAIHICMQGMEAAEKKLQGSERYRSRCQENLHSSKERKQRSSEKHMQQVWMRKPRPHMEILYQDPPSSLRCSW